MNVLLKIHFKIFFLILGFQQLTLRFLRTREVYGAFLDLHVSLSSKYEEIQSQGIRMGRTALLFHLLHCLLGVSWSLP